MACIACQQDSRIAPVLASRAQQAHRLCIMVIHQGQLAYANAGFPAEHIRGLITVAAHLAPDATQGPLLTDHRVVPNMNLNTLHVSLAGWVERACRR